MVPAAGADCASWISENMLSGARIERRLAAFPAADVAGCSRLLDEDDAGTLARLVGVVPAMCNVSDELAAALGHIYDATGVGIVTDVTALPLSPPASRINRQRPRPRSPARRRR